MWYNTIQHNTTWYTTTQYNNTKQYKIIQHNTTWYNTTQYNTAQYNTTQYNTAQYNTTQYNTAQYNTTQYNAVPCLPCPSCSGTGHCGNTAVMREGEGVCTFTLRTDKGSTATVGFDHHGNNVCTSNSSPWGSASIVRCLEGVSRGTVWAPRAVER